MNPGDELKTEKGISLSCFQMDHLSTSLAWSIEYSGKKLVYLGDGPDSPGLADFCMDADLLLVHCAGSDENPKPGHMFPAMAGKLAGRSKVKKLLLSHFYRMVEPDLAIKGAARYFSGSIIAAIDLLCLEF
jgi:ribonuclease BN (tRNA processing enzyme)